MPPNKSMTPKRAKQLQKQIEHDQAQPIKPTEKRIKIDNTDGFDSTIEILSKQKKQSE